MAKRKKRRPRAAASPRPKDGLNTKQRRFVAEYLVSGNASDAARKANYSPKTAYSQGQRLLKHVEVAAAIANAEQERFQRLQMTGDEILAELAHLGRSRLTDFLRYDSRGRLTFKPSGDLSDARAAALKKVKRTKRTTITKSGDRIVETTLELGLHDKVAPLKTLGQHAGLWSAQKDETPDVEPEARESVTRKLAQLAARRDAEVPREPDGAGGEGA